MSFVKRITKYGREVVFSVLYGADGFAILTDRQGAMNVAINTKDSANLDAFGRLRTSDPATLFDSVLRYDDQPLQWETKVATGGTTFHNATRSSVTMSVTTTDGSQVIRQSREYLKYQPGKSQQAIFTFVFGPGQDNLVQRAGYFDDEDGIFIELRGTTVRFVHRTNVSGSVVDNVVDQGKWVLDGFDGKGRSEVTLDVTKGQIVVIDLQWLSLGRVRVGFEIDGRVSYAHQFIFANIIDAPYMVTANLPMRYEILADGALGSAGSMEAICSAVASEGGTEDERAFPFTSGNGEDAITVSTRRPILSIRPRATFTNPEAVAITNRVAIRPQSVAVISDKLVYWELVYDGDLTDEVFADVDTTHSVTQDDVAATAISGGIVIEQGYVAAGGPVKEGLSTSGIRSRLPLSLDIDGANPINLSVVATNLDAGNAEVRAALSWRELR